MDVFPLIIVYSRGAAYRVSGEGFFCIRALVVSAVLKTD